LTNHSTSTASTFNQLNLNKFLFEHSLPTNNLHFNLHFNNNNNFQDFISSPIIKMSFTNTTSFTTQPVLAGRGGYNGPANESEDDDSFSIGAPLNFGRGGYNRGPDDDDEEDGRGGYN
jgi:hypothetical protein